MHVATRHFETFQQSTEKPEKPTISGIYALFLVDSIPLVCVRNPLLYPAELWAQTVILPLFFTLFGDS